MLMTLSLVVRQFGRNITGEDVAGAGIRHEDLGDLHYFLGIEIIRTS